VVLLGKNDSLPYLLYQTTSGAWYSRGKLPNPAGAKFSAIATGPGNGGSLQVLLLGATDSLPYLIYQTTSGNWIWAGHLPAFGSTKLTAIAAGSGNSDQLQVMGVGASDHLPYLIWQNGGGGWNWAGHLSAFGTTPLLNTVTSAGSGSSDNSNHLLKFYFLKASDNHPYAIVQDGSDGSWHLNANLVDFAFRAPLAADTGNLGLGGVMVVGIAGSPGAAPWAYASYDVCVWACSTGIGKVPPDQIAPFSAVAVGDGNDELLQVIGLGLGDGLPYLTWLDNGGSTWHWYGALPNPNSVPFKALATGNGNGGSLQVILLGRDDGLPYLIYQTTSGHWIWGGLLPDP